MIDQRRAGVALLFCPRALGQRWQPALDDGALRRAHALEGTEFPDIGGDQQHRGVEFVP